jgi:hypothetical protein
MKLTIGIFKRKDLCLMKELISKIRGKGDK